MPVKGISVIRFTMIGDLTVIGPAATIKRNIASGQTAIEAGEPLHSTSTLSSGAASANAFVLAAADTPVIGTHRFGGVAQKKSENAAAGTTLEQFLNAACPVPHVGRIRGRAETVASVDTLSELAGLIGDVVLIDYAATGASDGGQLYTIKEVASADTSGLEIVGGNTALSLLEVVVDARAYRHDVS
jgi:hypothetical protein